VLLDVRPFDEYAAGHIGGARHVDATRLTDSVEELLPTLKTRPTGAQIVAYCRGPYCAFAPQALRTLSRHGHRGALLPDGAAGWARSGRPLDHQSSAATR
jgi:rhodanese-related sulfurtransferase